MGFSCWQGSEGSGKEGRSVWRGTAAALGGGQGRFRLSAASARSRNSPRAQESALAAALMPHVLCTMGTWTLAGGKSHPSLWDGAEPCQPRARPRARWWDCTEGAAVSRADGAGREREGKIQGQALANHARAVLGQVLICSMFVCCFVGFWVGFFFFFCFTH